VAKTRVLWVGLPHFTPKRPKGAVVFQAMLEIAVKDQAGAPVGGARVVITGAAGVRVFDQVTPSEPATAMLVSDAGATFAVARPLRKAARDFVQAVRLQEGSLVAVLTTKVVAAKGAAPRTPHTLTITKAG